MIKGLVLNIKEADRSFPVSEEAIRSDTRERLFNYFLDGWISVENFSVNSTTFYSSGKCHHVSFKLNNPFPAPKSGSNSKKFDDSFINYLTAVKVSTHLLQISEVSIESILNETETLVVGFKLVFVCESRISSIQTWKSKLFNVKDLHFEHKLSLFYGVLAFACDMLRELGLFWTSAAEIPIVSLNNDKFKFIQFNGFRYVSLTTSEDSDSNDNWVQKGVIQQDFEGATVANYYNYFKEQLKELFDIIVFRMKKTGNKRLDSFNTEVKGIYLRAMGAKPTMENLISSKNKVQQLVFKFVSCEEKMNKIILLSKIEKFENQQTKISTILDCLIRYEWLLILDISKMPNKELKLLQSEARQQEIGEYHFVGTDIFKKHILPQIKQFKEGRASKRRLADLLKGQISLFFSNKDIFEVKIFIESFVHEEALNINDTVIPRDLVLAKEDVRWGSAKTHIFLYFNKLKLDYAYKPTSNIYELGQDWKIPKRTQLNGVLREIIREAMKLNRFYLKPYQKKFTILSVFEKGYQVPLHLLDVQGAGEKAVMKSLGCGFDYVRAIEVEANIKITDFSEEAKVISKFRATSRMLVAMLEDIREKKRNNFDALSGLFEDFSESGKKLENQEEIELNPLGDY